MLTVTRQSEHRHAGESRRIHSTSRPVRLQLVDDHPAVRRGLAQLLEDQPDLRVLAISATAAQAIEQAKHGRIDVAIVDYNLGGHNGLWACRRLRRLPHPPHVVIYSAYANDHLAASCVVAGADAVLNKGGLGSELCEAIRAVARGRRLLPRIPRPLADMLSRRLNDAELPIFGMLLAGLSRDDVRQTLHISEAELASRETAMLSKLEALPGEIGDRSRDASRIDREPLISQPKADAGLSM